nr:MAG TPA: hypothetical protein [Caudoviricetes sp.]
MPKRTWQNSRQWRQSLKFALPYGVKLGEVLKNFCNKFYTILSITKILTKNSLALA